MAWHVYDHFPVNALGDVLATAVWQHHGNSRLPIELIAPIALGMAAAAVHDLYDVQRPNLAASPVSLFVALIAGTGEGKDAAAAPFVRPFFDFQANADDEYETKLQAYEVDLQAWKVAEKVLLGEMEQKVRGNEDIGGVKMRLAAHLNNRPEAPRAPLVIYDDATVTAMKNSLCERWRAGMLFSMEGSDLFNGRLGAEYPFWNAGWGGQPIFSDRVTEGRRSVHDPRLGMVVGIQPVPFRRFLKRRGAEAHDSGFTARYLIAVPPSTKGYRLLGEWQASTDRLEAYAARARELLDASAEATMSGRERTILRFSAAAATRFVEIYNSLQMLMAPGQPYAEISGQAAKAAENVARVAAVLHVFDRLEGDISEDTLARAAAIVEWFVNQFLVLFSAGGTQPSVEQDALAMEHALWHALNCGHMSVPRSELKYWVPPELIGTRLDRGLRCLLSTGKVALIPHRGRTYVALKQGGAPSIR